MPDPKGGPAPPIAIISDRGAARLRAGHAWVYRAELLGFEGGVPAAGQAPDPAVMLRDRRGRELGWADHSERSQIALRRLTADASEAVDEAFFHRRLAAALAYRDALRLDSTAYRLVAGEADGLPGWIADRYGDAVVVQTLTPAMELRLPMLVALLRQTLGPGRIFERNDVKVRRLEGLELRAGLLATAGENPAAEAPPGSEAEATIGGLHLRFDLLGGQKTGGFLDQRENWAAAAAYAHPGSEALDAFCYQGGFALHLARRGARVEAADLSRPALELADANAQRNGLENIEFTEANAFDLLRHYDETGRRFDLIVLDPPAFAKNRSALPAAARGYKEINLRAFRLLRPGGVLVSCSCAHHVSADALQGWIGAAAADARREVALLERRGQARDHPVLLAMPETEYLKCFIFRVR
ncbi:MAG: class I SAM-dependent rRNA methyltransferase [Terriglobales bacterium]